MVHLLGTIFSSGWIHIWCSSEYLGQQDGVCVGLSQNKLQCVCSWWWRNMSASATERLTDVSLIVFGKHWSSMARGLKIYQAAILTQYLLVLVFLFYLLTRRKIWLPVWEFPAKSLLQWPSACCWNLHLTWIFLFDPSKLLRFEQYTSTRLLAQFDEDLQQVQKISMRINTGNVIGPRYKIRLLRIRFTPLERPERSVLNPQCCPLNFKQLADFILYTSH